MGFEIRIDSKKSKITSLKSIREKKADLNEHRKGLLDKVSRTGDYERFPKKHVTEEDLAFLSASCDCEFALLTGKNDDILFHGEKYCCEFDKVLSDLLKQHKYNLYAHSHPDEDKPEPSIADRKALTIICQESSLIISATTLTVTKYSNNQCLDYLL